MQYSLETIDQLNCLLRDEVLACESYERAIKKVDDQQCKEVLSDCLISHLQRVDKLKSEVTEGGGEPETANLRTHAFGQFIAQSASLLGDQAAISALEERENTIMRDYEDAIRQECDRPAKTVIENVLLPEQERTHAALMGVVLLHGTGPNS